MSSFRRRLMMAVASLPYDAEVQYIEKSGAAYIDTGIKAKSTITYDLTFYTPTHSGIDFIFGARNSDATVRFFAMNDQRSGQNYTRVAYGGTTITKTGLAAGFYNINNRVNGANNAYIGNEAYNNTAATFSTDLDIYLGAGNGLGTSEVPDKIYPCKLWDNGVLVRDYICVRKGGIGYLYDRVTKQLFGNANSSGHFAYGADVPYTCEVSYIASDGTAYIDTGINGNSTISVEHRFYLPSVSGNIFPFGGRVDQNNGRLFCVNIVANNILQWRFGANGNQATGNYLAGDNAVRTVKNVCYVNGSSITATDSTWTSSIPIFLGCMNDGGSAIMITNGLRHQSAYIFTNAAVSRAYVPVRIGSVGYLYDRINNTLTGNAASSGAFGLGTDIK